MITNQNLHETNFIFCVAIPCNYSIYKRLKPYQRPLSRKNHVVYFFYQKFILFSKLLTFNSTFFVLFSCRRRCKSLDGIFKDQQHFLHDSNHNLLFHIYSSASAFSVAKGSATGIDPELAMTTSSAGLSRPSVLLLSILRTTSIPLMIFPNTT